MCFILNDCCRCLLCKQHSTPLKVVVQMSSQQSVDDGDFSIPPPLIVSPAKPSSPTDDAAAASCEESLSPLSGLTAQDDVTTSPTGEAEDVAARSILDSSDSQLGAGKAKKISKKPVAEPKKQKKESSKRAREEVQDTAAADSRAAFRHSQRLLRKSAPSVDLKAALQRSFSQQHASPPTTSASLFTSFPVAALSADSQNALPTSPVASGGDVSKAGTVGATTTVQDVTQRFLSKVHEQRQQTIRTLVTRRESSSVVHLPPQAGALGNRRPQINDVADEEVELIVDAGNSRHAQNSNSALSSGKGGKLGMPASLSSPLFAVMDDSRSSGSQLSPTFSQPDEKSSPPQEQHADDDDDGVVNMKQEVSLISALQRKHELLKFKKQQQQAAALTPPSPLSGLLGPRSASTVGASPSAPTAAQPNASRIVTSTTLLQQRTITNMFHVSATDVTFLKRTNSFENSQSQSIVFRKDTTNTA